MRRATPPAIGAASGIHYKDAGGGDGTPRSPQNDPTHVRYDLDETPELVNEW